MAYYLGTRLPDEFDPNYEKGSWNDLQKMWHCGYEGGFNTGKYWVETERTRQLEQELDSLKSNFVANLRVAKEEIKKSIREENREPVKES